mmetsp:Transcript_35416/g.94288  ORF Transcript_35416/g.94288 Transcript_35416/m.94288 type:complete len:112 (+) Transcript_35416:192-527(+)
MLTWREVNPECPCNVRLTTAAPVAEAQRRDNEVVADVCEQSARSAAAPPLKQTVPGGSGGTRDNNLGTNAFRSRCSLRWTEAARQYAKWWKASGADSLRWPAVDLTTGRKV